MRISGYSPVTQASRLHLALKENKIQKLAGKMPAVQEIACIFGSGASGLWTFGPKSSVARVDTEGDLW